MLSQTQSTFTGSHVPPKLTFSERGLCFAVLLVFLPRAIFGVIHDLLMASERNSRYFLRSTIKHTGRILSTLSLRQGRSLMRTTGQKITELCESERVHHQVVCFDVDGFPPAALHFISSSAKNGGNILMYFHGGGYLYPMSSAHFKFARQAANRVTSTLVILEYGLSPEIKYPGQLAQAAAALQYLLQYHKPSEIVLGGDSAGGNLTLGLLAHLREPHPLIASVGLTEPLRAAFCISPRCSNECMAKSFTSNASKGVISSQTVTLINKNWDPVMTDVWATPNVGNREFWRKVYAKDLLITCGSDEVYLDDIKYLASIIGAEKEDRAKVQLAICPGEIHIQAISDFGLGIEDGQMLTTFFAWLHTI